MGIKSTRLDTGPVQFLINYQHGIHCKIERYAHKLLVKLRAALHNRMVDSFKAGAEGDFGHDAECTAAGMRLAE